MASDNKLWSILNHGGEYIDLNTGVSTKVSPDLSLFGYEKIDQFESNSQTSNKKMIDMIKNSKKEKDKLKFVGWMIQFLLLFTFTLI